MKPKIIRERLTDELKKQVEELNEELFGLKLKKSIGQLEQTANLRKARNNIARVKTVLREREQKEAQGVGPKAEGNS